jgi:hypothetical protein
MLHRNNQSWLYCKENNRVHSLWSLATSILLVFAGAIPIMLCHSILAQLHQITTPTHHHCLYLPAIITAVSYCTVLYSLLYPTVPAIFTAVSWTTSCRRPPRTHRHLPGCIRCCDGGKCRTHRQFWKVASRKTLSVKRRLQKGYVSLSLVAGRQASSPRCPQSGFK